MVERGNYEIQKLPEMVFKKIRESYCKKWSKK